MAKLKYETEDGKLFDDHAKAEEHEKMLGEAQKLAGYLDTCEGVWLDEDASGNWIYVAMHILRKYTVTKKESS